MPGKRYKMLLNILAWCVTHPNQTAILYRHSSCIPVKIMYSYDGKWYQDGKLFTKNKLFLGE